MKLSVVPILLMVSACQTTIPTHAEAVDLGDGSGSPPQLSSPCIPKIGLGIDPKFEAMCHEMTEPRVWRGLWVYGFEWSQFCAEPAKSCGPPRKLDADITWLTFGGDWPSGLDSKQESGAVFEIEFVGRRTVYAGSKGHMGIFQHEMVVDRLISMKEIKK